MIQKRLDVKNLTYTAIFSVEKLLALILTYAFETFDTLNGPQTEFRHEKE